MHGAARGQDGLGDRGLEPLGQVQHGLEVGAAHGRERDREGGAAEPAHRVARAAGDREPLAHAAQHVVGKSHAEAVGGAAELVDLDHEAGGGAPAPRRAQERVVEPVGDGAAQDEAREPVALDALAAAGAGVQGDRRAERHERGQREHRPHAADPVRAQRGRGQQAHGARPHHVEPEPEPEPEPRAPSPAPQLHGRPPAPLRPPTRRPGVEC